MRNPSPYRLLIVLFFLHTVPTFAHLANQNYLYLRFFEEDMDGRVELRISDINEVFDFEISSGTPISQLSAEISTIQDYITQYLKIYTDGRQHRLLFDRVTILGADGNDFLQFWFKLEGISPDVNYLDIDDQLMVERLNNHQAQVLIEHDWKSGIVANESLPSLYYDQGTEMQRLERGERSIMKGFTNMIRLGVWHIWIGIDHVLFLLALLLPGVITFTNRGEVAQRIGFITLPPSTPVESFKAAFFYILKVVTSFTIAHTITLSLAALEIIVLPSRLVESIIAISIALAALHNIYQIFPGREWLIAFGFGIFHGFGFASVLGEKGASGEFLGLSLFGFNLGVELGQIAIICVFFPVLFFVRKRKLYPKFMVIASIILILLSMEWFMERAFDFNIPVGSTIRQLFG